MVEGDPEVGENAVETVDMIEPHEVLHEPEVRQCEREAGVIEGIGAGIRVLVEAIEMAVGTEEFEDGARVAAAAEGGVGILAVRFYLKSGESLGKERRYVVSHSFIMISR